MPWATVEAPLFEAGPSCGLCLFSLCVAVPVAALTPPTETAGGTPWSRAADATGMMLEKQGFCFSGGGGGPI